MKEERMRKLRLIAVLGLAILMAIPISLASAESNYNAGVSSISHETGIILNIDGYSVDAGNIASALPSDLVINGYASGRGHYIIAFDGPVTKKMKTDVEMAGAKLIAPLGHDQFIAEISDSDLAKVKAQPHVAAVVIDQPAFRLSRFLDNINGPAKVKIYAFPGHDKYVVSQVTKLMTKNNAGWITSLTPKGAIAIDQVPLLDKNYGMITAVVYPSILHALAKINGVAFIEVAHNNWVMNDKSHSQIQNTHTDTTSVGAPDNLVAGAADATHTNVWNHGIYGTGVIIGETDTAVGVHHDMFRDPNHPYDLTNYPFDHYNPDLRKVVMYATYNSTGHDHNFSDDSPDHGSHVAGTILGYDNPVGGSSAYDGMAPGAKLSFGDIDKPEGGNGGNSGNHDYLNPPNNFYEMWNPLMTGNLSMVKICSHSWGGHVQDSNGNNVEQSYYMDENAMIDSYQWKYDKVFTWAAGNEGSNTHTVGIQAESKNTITVAAADRTDKIASFSSRGPTFDGRLKPDVTMAGTGINSVDAKSGDNKYVSEQGTSMATPGVAGAVGLIQEYFEKGYYPSGSPVSANAFEPSAALLKAEIINGAEEMTDSSATGNPYNGDDGYPSVDQGWGFINVDKSLYLGPGDSRDVRVWDNQFGISTGDEFDLKFDVDGTSQPFTVTLVWTDPPAAVGASSALINDLDLTVIGPNGDTYKGNVFKGTNPGYTPANTGDYDHINNVEEVKVVSGHGLTTGTYTVKITGYDIPVDPQKFALVVSGNLNLDHGIVYLDNKVYCEHATPTIIVEDADGGSSVNVTVSSEKTGDVESVTCNGGDSRYVGHISFTLDEANSGDGVLSVAGDDTITVTYNDGGFTTTFSAKVDAKGPVVSDVHVDHRSNVMADIAFATDEMALGAIRYGTDPNNLNSQTDYTDTYSTTIDVVLKGLQENTLYYYDVLAKDRCGHVTVDDNGGDHYTFTTDAKGDILQVISDKSGFDWKQAVAEYEDAYKDKGWSYNVWYVWDQGLPSLDTLKEYKVVSWMVGVEHYPQMTADERTLIKNYLDGGGRLWVNSHDVAWDFGDSKNSPDYSSSVHNWLLSTMKEDWKADNDFTSMHGLSGDPISGDYTNNFNYDAYRKGGSGDDIKTNNAGGTSSYVWYENDGGDNCGVKWVSSANNGTSGDGVWGGTPSQLVVDNFMWTAIDSRSQVHSDLRSGILDNTLIWLIGHDHPDVSVTNPSAGDSITSNTLTIQWDKTTYGNTGVYQTKIYYSDNGGDAWHLITTISGDSSSYNWDISSVPNGVNYDIKVEVYDDSNAHLMGSATSGVFSISRQGGDNEGPVIVAGTQSVEPVPVKYNSTMWINATADDTNKGGSDIQDVVFYIDSTSGTPIHMSAADGLFNSMKEAATWNGTCHLTNGDHTAYIRAKDSSGNWGDFATVTFHVNGAPPSATVNVVSGWNLISLPWLKNPVNITTALDGFSWTRAIVYVNGQWYTYDVDRDAKYNIGFPDVDNTMGIWVYATADGNKSDISSGTTDIQLGLGWNLVGYPTSMTMTVQDALSTFNGQYDIVQWYNATSGNMETLGSDDYMVPGYAYWIHVTSAGTWSVDWEQN